MKRIVKPARKTPKKPPAMPRTAEIASGTETETCCAPSWTFPAAPESPSQEGSSSESRRLSTICGRSCRKSRTHPDERHEQDQQQHEDGDRRAEDGDRRREPTRHPRLRHHEAHGVLEDERQEDADEDDEERVADRPERDRDSDDGQDGEQRPRREQELGAPHSSSFHCAEGYGGVRLDRLRTGAARKPSLESASCSSAALRADRTDRAGSAARRRQRAQSTVPSMASIGGCTRSAGASALDAEAADWP